MTQFRASELFWESYAKLPNDVKEKARLMFKLFRQGVENPPFHPSLRIRKMIGSPNIWEGHITLQYVFTFEIEEDLETGERLYFFRKIGTQEIYRNP